MKTLHIIPDDCAGASLRQAIRAAGLEDQVLAWPDDLSCGPIASDDPSARTAWWESVHSDRDVENAVRAFWDCVVTTDDRLVVWFGRHSSSELAFFLAWADRLGEKPYFVMDVTGLEFPSARKDGSAATTGPIQAAGLINPDHLRSILGSEHPVSPEQREEARQQWRRLKAENAPFRVVTPSGLVSAPADHFDASLLQHVTRQPRKVARVIGTAMMSDMDPYIQVGDLMLLTRIVALIEAGKLLAKGDIWNMRFCEVWLPG